MRLAELGRLWPSWPLGRLRRGDWRRRPVPAASESVPTMLMADELRLLASLTEDYWRGEGIIIDAGCFLGGSTVALASGLRANLARRRLPETPLIHSYDLFRIEDWTRGLYFPETAQAGDSTRARFDRNVAAFAPLLRVIEGDITASEPPDEPIEILFIDIAKHWTVCDWITENLFPRLIPGRSIVVQQDYLWGESTGWLQVAMEYYSDEFEIVCDTWRNSVAFRLVKPFAPGRLRPRLVESVATAEKAALMERAAARFPPEQAAVLRTAAAHFMAMLGED
jgi:hypothetical protein